MVYARIRDEKKNEGMNLLSASARSLMDDAFASTEATRAGVRFSFDVKQR